MKILSVIGTRPEAVKLSPVIKELVKEKNVQVSVLVTAQHREMLDEVLNVFNIIPNYDFDIMSHNQSPTDVFAQILTKIQSVFVETNPDWLLIQGDTTTVLASTIAATYAKIPVAHVEAGLRTYDHFNPFPEEINRVLTDHVSSIHFAPTKTARDALLKEGISHETIHVTGNTVIDALNEIIQHPAPELLNTIVNNIQDNKKIILVTSHRRENFGQPFQNIIQALVELSQYDDTHIIYPAHPNPNIQKPLREKVSNIDNISIIDPLDYITFTHLMKCSYLILTDSGGIQEEAPGLGIPVLVLRKITERTEAIDQGTAQIVGTNPKKIVDTTRTLIENPLAYDNMIKNINPFGDGNAAIRIAKILIQQQKK